jgi:hypothetical protein
MGTAQSRAYRVDVGDEDLVCAGDCALDDTDFAPLPPSDHYHAIIFRNVEILLVVHHKRVLRLQTALDPHHVPVLPCVYGYLGPLHLLS